MPGSTGHVAGARDTAVAWSGDPQVEQKGFSNIYACIAIQRYTCNYLQLLVLFKDSAKNPYETYERS